MFTANIDEPSETYLWEQPSAARFEDGAAPGFRNITQALWEYAVAGVLHMDHLAGLVDSPLHASSLRRAARDTAEALDGDPVQVEQQLRAMLERHADEWRAFRRSLGRNSFINQLASARP